jgi:hypothetical protein
LAKQLYLLKEPYSPYHKYEPEVVLEDNCRLFWGCTVLTGKILHGNLPHLQLGDKTNKKTAVIDIQIPFTPQSTSNKYRKTTQILGADAADTRLFLFNYSSLLWESSLTCLLNA